MPMERLDSPASSFKFEVGESVIWINDYGVDLGKRAIIDRAMTSFGPAYYLDPIDTPWCPVREDCLHHIPAIAEASHG